MYDRIHKLTQLNKLDVFEICTGDTEAVLSLFMNLFSFLLEFYMSTLLLYLYN